MELKFIMILRCSSVFFSLDDKNFTDFKKQLESLDTDNLTPVEALVKLSELKKKITDND